MILHILNNLNQYDYFHENRLPEVQRKFVHFVDIDKFKVVFQFIKCFLEFDVNNPEWTQERVLFI